MNNAFSFLIMLGVCMGVSSCRNSSDQDNKNDCLHVKLCKIGKELYIEDIMKIDHWIEIDKDSMAYIGHTSKIEVSDSSIYILDRLSNKSVLRYGIDGKLINKIGSIGNGAGEYPNVYDFTVGREDGTISILSSDSRVYAYTPEGDHTKTLKISDKTITCITSNSNGILASSGYSDYEDGSCNYLLYQFTNAGKKTGEWIEYRNPLLAAYTPIINNPLSSVKEYSYYVDHIKKKVYRFDPQKNNVSVILSFELENAMPEEYYGDNMRFISEQMNYSWIKDTVITEDSMLISFVYKGELYASIISFNDGEIVSGHVSGMLPTGYIGDDGYIYSAVSPDGYMDYWTDIESVPKPKFDVTDETNLLLIKWKLANRK